VRKKNESWKTLFIPGFPTGEGRRTVNVPQISDWGGRGQKREGGGDLKHRREVTANFLLLAEGAALLEFVLISKERGEEKKFQRGKEGNEDRSPSHIGVKREEGGAQVCSAVELLGVQGEE